MDTTSAASLARQLNTSVPRVTRAAERLGLDARRPNGRFAFDPRSARRVREALGFVPRVEGLSRSELAVLAALRDAPLGLASARAVARRSGLSPTVAARSLERLAHEELVERSAEMVAAGRAREAVIWRANVQHPRWPSLDPVLARVERPSLPAGPRGGQERVPARLRHLFWNTAESQLDVGRAGAYIARRLLRTMDLQGLAWGARALAPGDWQRAARARGLDPAVRRLALNLAASGESRDLDFFFHGPVDLGRLRDRLGELGAFAVTHESDGTLQGLFGATKIEFLDASTLHRLAEPVVVAGLRVAALQDLMAMKLKVLAERGEMRDYFDVKAIDEEGSISVEEGVALYMRRYGIDPSSDALPHLYRAMGDLSDVEVDDLLPIDLADLQRWWGARQARLLRNSDRFG